MQEQHTPAMYQHLTAQNDRNGNPRRLYLVMDADGNIMDAIDEGYAGCPRWLRDLIQLPSIEIQPKTYREMLRDFTAKERTN
jgi:hypothetical protein